MGKDFTNVSQIIKEDSPAYCGEKEREMDSIISRFTDQKGKAIAAYMEKGKKDGLEWANRASYLDVASALNNSCFETGDPSCFNEREEIWEDFVEETWDEDSKLGRGKDNFNLLTDAWVKGFLSGIEEFWAEVKDKVEA